jgi:RHS repeat-associated protein
LTKFAYDTSGALTSVTNALNQVVNVNKHLPGGLPQTIVNANGVTTNLTYDARQRLLSTAMATSAGVLTTSYSYDGAGNLVTVTQPDGSSITNSYDASHRLIGVADKLGNRVAYGLDAFGDRIQTTVLDPSANSRLTRSGTFDALGRLVQAIGGANQLTTFSYDSDGNRLTVTDPLSHTTQQSFDALNRPIKGTNAANGITSMGYDSHDRITSIVDPNSASTSYIYDGFGEAIQQVSPTAGTMVYHYDSGGNLSQTVDGRGVVANYTYDALDREVSVIYPGNSAENVAYTYDEASHGFGVGRLTSIADAAGALSRAYDERGNLLSEMRTSGAATLATTYSYDAASRTASITYPSQWSVTYTRDTMGRITAVNAQAPGGKATQSIVSAVGYQPFGAVNALTYGNGIAETRSFDLDYRLKSITDIVQKLTYSYDAAGNVLGVSDGLNPPNNQIAGYDALNRLTSASGSYGGLNYSYDANGNRLSDTSSTTSDGLGSVTSLTYNQGGRLATASNAQQQLTEYSYDAFGHRLVKVGAVTATTIYQYSRGGQLLEEADGQGHPQVDYVYMDSRPIATIQASNNQVYFLHSDRLDAPQMATDGAQAIAWSTSYQPFGQISSAPTAITEDLRLPGQESDIETGLYHNGFRDYVPGWGRYQASDPIGLAGGLNGYAYVGSNPLRYADPFGLCPPPDVSAPGPTPSADPTTSALLAQLQSLNPGDWGQFALGTWDSAVSTLADSLNEVGEGLAGDALAAAQDLANLQKLALGAAGVVLNGLAIAVDVGQSLSGQKLATLAADLIAGGVAIGVGVLLAPAVAVGGATAVVIGTGVAVIGAAVNWAIGAGVKNILLGGNRATLY